MKTEFQRKVTFFQQTKTPVVLKRPVVLFSFGFLILGCSFKAGGPGEINYTALDLPKQPNILWIVAEDLSAYLPMFGDSTITTPNLSRLAREGVTYTHVFSPSRAALLTGRYPQRIGINGVFFRKVGRECHKMKSSLQSCYHKKGIPRVVLKNNIRSFYKNGSNTGKPKPFTPFADHERKCRSKPFEISRGKAQKRMTYTKAAVYWNAFS